jgi:glutathione synthase/RimK-type ligase-like ATP-grasp enzyme
MDAPVVEVVGKVCLLTCPKEDMHECLWDLARNETCLHKALKEQGLDFFYGEWGSNEEQMQLIQKDADVVLIRSTWDYSDNCATKDRFLVWLKRLTLESNAILLNPLDVVRWNSDKRYMLYLESKGVAIVPTKIVERGSVLPDVFQLQKEWNHSDAIIVKPVVGASARGLSKHILTNDDKLEQAELAHKSMISVSNEDGGAIVQPFLSSIFQGETSVICVEGVPLLAVLKTPQNGDFRVQEEYGGVNTVIELTEQLLNCSEKVIRSFPFPMNNILYARLDFVGVPSSSSSSSSSDDIEYLLIEAECIEPELFVNMYPPLAQALACAISSVVKKRKQTETETEEIKDEEIKVEG